MARVQDQAPSATSAEEQWIEENLAEQAVRHEKIVEDMETISDERDEWVDGFLERLQTRGFNFNCDSLQKIEREELPKKPKRPFKVVF